MASIFVTGQADVFFYKEVIAHASTPDEAVSLLEKHFLDKRARRVNDAVCSELTFNFLRRKREVENFQSDTKTSLRIF